MQALVDMANGKRKLMPNWGYNFIDVRDLCDAAISAVDNGRSGQNYLVGGEYNLYLYIAELIEKAKEVRFIAFTGNLGAGKTTLIGEILKVISKNDFS